MSKLKPKNVDHQTLWAIRDARDLDAWEKAFLFVVATRGLMFTTAARAAADMGMGLTKFYAVRKSLLSRALVSVTTRGQGNGSSMTTTYSVNLDEVRKLLPSPGEEFATGTTTPDGEIPPASRVKPLSQDEEVSTAVRSLRIRRTAERRSPEGSPEEDHKTTTKPEPGWSKSTQEMSPYMKELTHRIGSFTEKDLRLVFLVCLYNRKHVQGLEFIFTSSPPSFAFGGMSPAPTEDFRKILGERPGLLQELLLELPEEELKLAFDLGPEGYRDHFRNRTSTSVTS
ncbi:hypothetical protein G5V58_04125 [Nocardioides anomalus]|uniref:Helix-turn-helix domain-containing protein n=1 Tax=Nocardioides anomalus TaxID=2712223 RepID=A0A6G6WA81_9ACTN|nr:hypothetical protein [Nocardioides anomalus]QIG42067.1 hypothetical protein G5V58_04125 [Nocardioides anomalus]